MRTEEQREADDQFSQSLWELKEALNALFDVVTPTTEEFDLQDFDQAKAQGLMPDVMKALVKSYGLFQASMQMSLFGKRVN